MLAPLRLVWMIALALWSMDSLASTDAVTVDPWSTLRVKVGDATYVVNLRVPENHLRAAQRSTQGDRLPLVVFLHGAGERGQDPELVRSVGLPILPIAQPHLLLVPQVPEGLWWSDLSMMKLVMAAIEETLARYPADRNKILLTGLSMGGHGVLQLAARYPDQFAGVVAICPRLGRPGYLAPGDHIVGSAKGLALRLHKVPIWLFHGDQDEVVPVNNSRRLARALDRLGANTRYTEISGGDHAIWPQVYSRADVVDWLFDQERAR